MSAKDDGGLAFPSHGSMGEVVQEGMSLRDYFAAKAMAGLIANATYGGELQRVLDHNKQVWDATGEGSGAREYVAALAYGFADAMLAERAKGGDALSPDEVRAEFPKENDK